jgi:hypothetical protein
MVHRSQLELFSVQPLVAGLLPLLTHVLTPVQVWLRATQLTSTRQMAPPLMPLLATMPTQLLHLQHLLSLRQLVMEQSHS